MTKILLNSGEVISYLCRFVRLVVSSIRMSTTSFLLPSPTVKSFRSPSGSLYECSNVSQLMLSTHPRLKFYILPNSIKLIALAHLSIISAKERYSNRNVVESTFPRGFVSPDLWGSHKGILLGLFHLMISWNSCFTSTNWLDLKTPKCRVPNVEVSVIVFLSILSLCLLFVLGRSWV